MTRALNLTLKLKQDPASKQGLKLLKEEFATQIQPAIDAALRKSERVHFARVLVVDDLYLQVLTEYDGSPDSYTEFFRKELPQVFKAVFALAEGMPDWNTLNEADEFFKQSKAKDLAALGEGVEDPNLFKKKELGYLFSAAVTRPLRNWLNSAAEQGVTSFSSQGRRLLACQLLAAHSIKRFFMANDAVAPNLANVQGLIVRGYTHPVSRHLLYEFPNSAAGKSFLSELTPDITTAGDWKDAKPSWHLNLGISFSGLKALGLAPEVLDAFPFDFQELPNEASMGDVGDSAPAGWWQRRFNTAQIHACIHLFANDSQQLDKRTADLRSIANRLDLRELLPANNQALQGGFLPDRRVHFGYRDGISQPNVNWGNNQGGTVDFRHFLLGYANAEIGSAPSGEIGAQFRDSSYAGLRWLYKDVARFNAFLATEGPKLSPTLPSGEAEELLAAKLLGRWRNGTPLVLSPDQPSADPALQTATQFNYAHDPQGERCPCSAHIRVVNPRDQALSPINVNGVPPLIRRGTPFGPPLVGTKDDQQQRGLIGIFICASITRQFYTLIGWMNRNDFSPVFKDIHAQDPFANRQLAAVSPDFVISRQGQADHSVKLQNFSKTLGTAFFLLPSIKTLEYLAS